MRVNTSDTTHVQVSTKGVYLMTMLRDAALVNDEEGISQFQREMAEYFAELEARQAFPEKLTPELSEVLELTVLSTGPIGRLFRGAGNEIPRKVEKEQAFVLHRFIHLALKHGADWKKFASDDMDAAVKIRDRVAEIPSQQPQMETPK